MGDGNDQRVSNGEIFQPRCGLLDAICLGCGWVPTAQRQQQGPPADRECPGQQWETKRAEMGSSQIELAQQRGDQDLAAARQQPSRGQGARGVAGDHQVGALRERLEVGGHLLAFLDARRFVGFAPGSEARGIDPAGVDVRRAGDRTRAIRPVIGADTLLPSLGVVERRDPPPLAVADQHQRGERETLPAAGPEGIASCASRCATATSEASWRRWVTEYRTVLPA